LEDLNVAGMMKNPKLARSVADASLSELHRQLRYKAEWFGVPVVVADRWFASSKTCSNCGAVKEKLSLSDRVFVCGFCGHTQDRDLNAALNLKNLAVSSTVSACGVEGSGNVLTGVAKPATMKQELNSVPDSVRDASA
jgi:putative transposase